MVFVCVELPVCWSASGWATMRGFPIGWPSQPLSCLFCQDVKEQAKKLCQHLKDERERRESNLNVQHLSKALNWSSYFGGASVGF